jgi:uncharacterized membrane protein
VALARRGSALAASDCSALWIARLFASKELQMDGAVLVVLLGFAVFAWFFTVDREARRRVAVLERVTHDLGIGLHHAHARTHHIEQWLQQQWAPPAFERRTHEPATPERVTPAPIPQPISVLEAPAAQVVQPPPRPAPPAPAAVARDSAAPPPREPAPASGLGEDQPSEPVDLERWLGVRGAAALGAVVLVVALFYFLRFSAERGWLTPTLRVVFGFLASFAALAASELKLRRVHPTMGAWIAGASFGGLFASTWAAHRVVGLIDAPAAFGAFVVCAIATLAYATRRDSAPVALLGLVGGLAAPLAFHTGGEMLTAAPLSPLVLAYVFLLDVAVVTLSVRRGWWSCALLSLGSTAGYVGWFLLDEGRPLLAQAVPSLLIAGIFGALPGWMWTRARPGDAPGGDPSAQLLRFGAVLISGGVGVWLASGPTTAHTLVGLVSLLATHGIALVLQRRGAQGLAELAGVFVVLGAASSLGRVVFDGLAPVATLTLSVAAIVIARGTTRFLALGASCTPVDVAALLLFFALSLEGPLVTASFVIFGALVLVRFFEHARRVEETQAGETPEASGEVAGLLGALCFFARWTLDPDAPTGTRQLLALAVVLAMFGRAILPRRLSASASRAIALVGDPSARPLLPVARAVALTTLLATLPLAAAKPASALEVCAALGLGLGMLSGSGRASIATRVVAASAALGGAAIFGTLHSEHLTLALGLSLLVPAYLGVEAAWGPRALDEEDVDGLLLALLALAGVAVRVLAGPHALVPYAVLTLLAGAATLRALRSREQETGEGSLLVLTTAGLLAYVLAGELSGPPWLVALASETLLATVLYRHRPLRAFLVVSGVGLLWVAKVAALAAITRLAGAITPLVVATVLAAHVWILLRDRAKVALVELLQTAASLAALGAGLALVSALAVGLREGQSATESSLFLSLGWGLYGTAVLALGVRLVSPNLRWLGLGAILVTCGKVFLFDLADLRDLARVASLVGLAVSLLGVSGLYQRFVRRAGAAELGPRGS